VSPDQDRLTRAPVRPRSRGLGRRLGSLAPVTGPANTNIADLQNQCAGESRWFDSRPPPQSSVRRWAKARYKRTTNSRLRRCRSPGSAGMASQTPTWRAAIISPRTVQYHPRKVFTKRRHHLAHAARARAPQRANVTRPPSSQASIQVRSARSRPNWSSRWRRGGRGSRGLPRWGRRRRRPGFR
jgi:hypothetical protein